MIRFKLAFTFAALIIFVLGVDSHWSSGTASHKRMIPSNFSRGMGHDKRAQISVSASPAPAEGTHDSSSSSTESEKSEPTSSVASVQPKQAAASPSPSESDDKASDEPSLSSSSSSSSTSSSSSPSSSASASSSDKDSSSSSSADHSTSTSDSESSSSSSDTSSTDTANDRPTSSTVSDPAATPTADKEKEEPATGFLSEPKHVRAAIIAGSVIGGVICILILMKLIMCAARRSKKDRLANTEPIFSDDSKQASQEKLWAPADEVIPNRPPPSVGREGSISSGVNHHGFDHGYGQPNNVFAPNYTPPSPGYYR